MFFAAIVTRDGRILFTERDAHDETVRRARLRDDDMFLRHWVRVTVPPTVGSCWLPAVVDETTTPPWFDEDRARLLSAVVAVAARVRPAWEAHQRARRPVRTSHKAAQAAALPPYVAALTAIDGYVPRRKR